MDKHFDIVIAGGGMVGLSLALQLGASLPPSTSILLVESYPFPKPMAAGAPDYHPSFDARSTALSYSSQRIYQNIGVWDLLSQWCCPIEKIHVSSRGRFGSTLLDAQDCGWPALGYVAENPWLGNALAQSLYRQARVELCSPAQVTAARTGPEGAHLQLRTGDTTEDIRAELLLICDGAGSRLCEDLGVQRQVKSYGQHALIANIATAEAHAGCAFERFTDEGPLALLPLMPSSADEHRSALVWTLPPARAEKLLAAEDMAFVEELQLRFGYRLGRVEQVGERQSYPLTLVQSLEQVRRSMVVMGNAAHALHPVAGQGFNLALRDVACLARTLRGALDEGKSLGEPAVLHEYQARQAEDQQRTIGFSDRVPGLFMTDWPLFSLGRDLALAGMDLLPSAKREFVRHAAGIAAAGSEERV
ncbi:MAG: 2-octaprenyl-6-methoxyphenyl hydroxylase [Pseudomonadota bacterium]